MGSIIINIQPELVGPIADEITISSFAETVCSTEFTVNIQVTSSVYIQWALTGPFITVEGGAAKEVLPTGLNSFDIVIEGFRGFNVPASTTLSEVVVEIRESEFGNLLDTRSFSRVHTNNLC